MTSWRHAFARVNGIRMHYVVQGSGKPLVLLHGWPQTWYQWRLLIPALAERYTVIAPDLRGYGLTDKPLGGFDKRTMAADVRALVRSLGFERVVLVGHDRGARVAHRYGLDYPDEVEKLAVLDIVPTRAMFQRTNTAIARGFWHWFFHLQPDLPEVLVGPNVEAYLRYFFERWTWNRAVFDDAAVAEYVRAYSAPGALRSGFNDYRASFPDDVAADDESAAAGRKLTQPVLVLWGSHGLIGEVLPVLEIWREYAVDVRGGPIPECGHFLPEEQPDLVLARLREFLEAEG
ncbi:MAG TPA: alpha/beta hydrolase [Chloroflexota bacterium]